MPLKINVIKPRPQPEVQLTANPVLPEFADIPDPFGFGQRAVDYLRSLKHPKSTLPGKAFQLDPWQEDIVRKIYGPRYTEDEVTEDGILVHAKGDRIVSDVLILVPRGNRKTSLTGAFAVLHLIGPEAAPYDEIVGLAVDKEQAGKMLTEAQLIIEASFPGAWVKGRAALQIAAESKIKLQSDRILVPSGASLKAISADADAQHGSTPKVAIVDELHAHKSRKLWDVVDTGLAKTRNSLRITITTAGRGQDHIAWDHAERFRKVARGDVINPKMLPILFEATAADDWQDESVWRRVNPGLRHGYPNFGELREKARAAQDSPANRDNFQMLHLNFWLDKSLSRFVDQAVYDKGSAPLDFEALNGQPCWIGVDLGVTDDLSAVVCAFHDPAKEGGYIVIPSYFMPGDNVSKREAQSGFAYGHHISNGDIFTTPGNVTDYTAIDAHLRELCETYHVKEIAFDPHYGGQIMQGLQNDGYPIVTFRQGWATMGPAIKELERAILAQKFRHGGHPVLRWNFANIFIQDDGKGNRSFNKSRSADKIDGAVATAMAVARAAAGQGAVVSIYDNPDDALAFGVW